MSFAVRRIEPHEGLRLRAARLRLLAEVPARRALLDAERGWPDEEWEERAARGAAGRELVTFVAEAGDEWLGMVDGLATGDAVADVAGLWVEPSHRRRGIGRALADAVQGWAAGRGDSHVGLWVLAGNEAAGALFAAAGFVPAGEPVPTADGAGLQRRLVRPVE